MGEFEELRRVGTKLSREAEEELKAKKKQLEEDAKYRQRQEENSRRKKDEETKRKMRDELERKRAELERKEAQERKAREKERARLREEKEREQEKDLEKQRRARANGNGNGSAPTYRNSQHANGNGNGNGYGAASKRSVPEPPRPVPKKQEFSFDYLAKMAQSGRNGASDGNHNTRSDQTRSANNNHTNTEMSDSARRQAAIDKARVRTYSPERPVTALPVSNILKKMPVKRNTGPKSPFPAFRPQVKIVNPIRENARRAILEGPVALNTKKRDLRTIEEITNGLHASTREARIKAIEEEREQTRKNRERAFQAAKMNRAMLSDRPEDVDDVKREVEKSNGKSQSRNSRSVSPPPKRRSRSRSPLPTIKKRQRSPSPTFKKRQRSPSPMFKKKSNVASERDRERDRDRDRDASRGRDRERERERERDRERDRNRDRERERERERDRDRPLSKSGNGSSANGKRRDSRSISPPRGGGGRRGSSPTLSSGNKARSNKPSVGSRPRFPGDSDDDDMSLSGVLGKFFGTRYRTRAPQEDFSDDDMEARPDEVLREEARSARIAREEDEREAQMEKEAAERAKRRKMEREKGSSRR